MATAVALIAAFVLTPVAGAVPFEPNDTQSAAAGPLLFGQTYDAGIETSTDKDFFYFYVTAPGKVPTTIALRNLSDGSEVIGLNAAIIDASGETVDAFAYSLTGGREATTTADLEPQRYLLEIKPSLETSFGIPYQFVVSGSPGAFGSYEEIAARCAGAMAAIKSARGRLQHARSKLQRASARLRQSIYGPANERRNVRRHVREAKAIVAKRRGKLNSASGRAHPWCSISQ